MLAAAAVGCSSPASGATPAWRRTVLVELFTSQGCSSCPPADAFVRALPSLGLGRDKVVALTFHVDYWDGLGWKDPFANAAFTRRQEWYAASAALRSPEGTSGLHGLYTPQMIVDGTVHFSGQQRQVALREMERAGTQPPRFELAVEVAVHDAIADLSVRLADAGAPRPDETWRLVAALAAKKTRTSVRHGENGGETLEEAQVVRSLTERTPIPPAGSTAHLRVSKPRDLAWPDADIVVFVQSEATREIGAVRVVNVRQPASK